MQAGEESAFFWAQVALGKRPFFSLLYGERQAAIPSSFLP